MTPPNVKPASRRRRRKDSTQQQQPIDESASDSSPMPNIRVEDEIADLLSIRGADEDGDINLQDLFSEDAFGLDFDLDEDPFLTNAPSKPVDPEPLNPQSSAECLIRAPARIAVETSMKSGTKREALSPPVECLEMPSVAPTIDDKFRGRSSVPAVTGVRETSNKRVRSNVRTLPLLSFPDSYT